GLRNAKAVIVPSIDQHVGAGGHVAGCAGERRTDALMPMMFYRRILARRMTLHTYAVAGRAQLAAVRLVAVAAGDAGRKHLTLFERAVIVDLLNVAHLPIGVVKPACKRRDRVGIRKPAAGNPILREFAAPGVAAAAGLDLLAQHRGREIALRIAGRGIKPPRNVATLVETSEQALALIFLLAERPPALPCACPRDVARSFSVP